MIKQQFNQVTDRKGSGSMKWSVEQNELPMWVADMDFRCCDAIVDALRKRVEHGIFGYSDMDEEWEASICDWWQKRHHWTLKKEWLLFCNGVIPIISSAIRRLTSCGDRIVTMTPVYHIFFHSIEHNGRFVCENELIYRNHQYEIDFEHLEKQLSDPRTTMLILCNPHNPIGKIWQKEELIKIGSLCAKHHVTVITDEIHCDLVDPKYEYVPFASASELNADISITCVAPTKTFNIAGIHTAAAIVPNESLRCQMRHALNDDEVAEPNVFALPAAIAAFREGEPWLEALREYIAENKQLVAEALQDETDIHVIEQQATYLMWIDCSKLCTDSEQLCDFLRRQTGLMLSSGTQFRGNGHLFLRMNVACPKSILMDGIERLKQGIHAYREQLK